MKNLIPSWLALPTWLTGSDNTVTNVTNIEESEDDDDEQNAPIEINDQGSALRNPLEEFDVAGPSGVDTRLLGSRRDLVNRSSKLIENNDSLQPSNSTFARGPLHKTTTASLSISSPVLNGKFVSKLIFYSLAASGQLTLE